MIPRIVHRIWLGENPMPEDFERYGDTWREHHPGWELRLWTDDTLEGVGARDLLERARFPAEASDFLRLEILRQFGGIYIDTDVECLRPIDSLVGDASALVVRKRSKPPLFDAFIMGAVPGHPAVVRMLEEIRELAFREDFKQSFKYVINTRLVERMAESPDVVVVGPPEVVNAKRRGEPLPPAEELGDTYLIHHRAGSGRETDDPSIELLRLRYLVAKQGRQLERLAAIESSAWWRLGQRVSPLLSAARSAQERLRR